MITIQYQPNIVSDASGMSVYNLDGFVIERLEYGRSLSDINHSPWRTAGELNFHIIDDLNTYKIGRRVRALECIMEQALMLTLLGYGENAQEVLDWFIEPSYGRWVQQEIPYLMRVSEMGSSRLVAGDVSCTIDGLVTFTVDILGEEVDLSMPWDRFLLNAKIDVKGDLYESI